MLTNAEVPEDLTAWLEHLYSLTDDRVEDDEVAEFILRQVLEKDAQFFAG